MSIKTAGELRGFLADVMVDIRAGEIDATDANAIAKIAAQINQSLSTEINAAIQLERMGKSSTDAGLMIVGNAKGDALQLPNAFGSDGTAWCEQCDARTSLDDAKQCKSPHCSLRGAVEKGSADPPKDQSQ